MKATLNNTIGELVSQNYRAADIFKHYGIDFCCGGGITLEQACAKKGIRSNELLHQLDTVVIEENTTLPDYNQYPLNKLVSHIEDSHHRYIEKNIPIIGAYLEKLTKVHGVRHPELLEIRDHFQQSALDLTTHMKKEELILFPFIKQMVKSLENHRPMTAGLFGSISNPINMMMEEHVMEGDRFKAIEKLSNGFTPPADGCTTYRVAYFKLKEFQEYLHCHIHLENNILFPRALEMERKIKYKYA